MVVAAVVVVAVVAALSDVAFSPSFADSVY